MGKILKLKSGIILLLVATVLALAIAPATVSAVPTCVDCPGDANGDGNIDASDITMTELVWLDPGTYPPALFPGADAGWIIDGLVNGIDVRAVELRFIGTWPPNLVYIDAPSSVDPGTSFTATVWINIVLDFDSANYEITYDPSVIQVTGVSGGQIRLASVPIETWEFNPPATQGAVRIINNIPGAAGSTGSGYLANIQFQVVGAPGQTSPISFNTSECSLADTYGLPISIPNPTWQADSVTVSSAPTPTPTPPPGSVSVGVDAPDDVGEGTDFTANVTIGDVSHLANGLLYVDYDPAVLELTNVTSGLIGGTAVYIDFWELVPPATQGTGKTIVRVLELEGASGSGTLCQLQFHVVGSSGNTSAITPHGIELTNVIAGSIPSTASGDSVNVVP